MYRNSHSVTGKRLKNHEEHFLAWFFALIPWNRDFLIIEYEVSGIYSFAGRMAYLLLLAVCKRDISPIASANRVKVAGY